MRGAVLLGVSLLAVALAGCSHPPRVVAQTPTLDPLGEPFADERHCLAYNLLTTVPGTDLQGKVPAEWSFPNPVAVNVRILVVRCPDHTVGFLTVPMRAGKSASDPPVEYLLQAFNEVGEGSDGSDGDDWARMGAPFEPGTFQVSDKVDALSIESPKGWVVHAAMSTKRSPGSQYDSHTLYGAGRPVKQTWAEESAILSSTMEVSSIAFGPGSVLSNAHVVPLNSGTWWGAYNAWYREGWPS